MAAASAASSRFALRFALKSLNSPSEMACETWLISTVSGWILTLNTSSLANNMGPLNVHTSDTTVIKLLQPTSQLNSDLAICLTLARYWRSSSPVMSILYTSEANPVSQNRRREARRDTTMKCMKGEMRWT